jgi:iron(III) transport system ATP-binding protein
VEALKGVDLDITAGQFVTLLGPSGCGKTTTLRLIAGLEQATSGSIELFGKTVVDVQKTLMRPPMRRPISMVFQSYALWPHLTALKNVMFPLSNKAITARSPRLAAMSGAQRHQAAKEALQLVKCGHLGDRYPGEMSGGQQQRIALARALVVEPQLLLLDEPLSNLDAALRRELRFELRALQESLGFTAIYVTHDQVEALSMSDRVILMNNGSVEQHGTPEDLFRRPRTRYAAAFIGDHVMITGQVVSLGTRAHVRTIVGQVQATLAGDNPVAVGDTVTVAIRTDRLRAVRDESGTVEVTGAAYCGAYIDIAARAHDATTLIARQTDSHDAPHRGDRVRVEVVGEGVIVDD